MLYIANQTGMRIADLHTVSVLTPERDREDDGVYKIMINGMDFGHYKKKDDAEAELNNIKEFIKTKKHGIYELRG